MKYILSKFDESIKAQGLTNIDVFVNGMFVVDAPEGVQIEDPSSYVDLKTKKYAGLLGLYTDFTDVVYDEFDSDALLDYIPADFRASVGKYDILVPGSNGRAYTIDRALGYIPTQIIVYWSVFTLASSQNTLKGVDVSYTPAPPSDLTVEVSFDAGAIYTPVVAGNLETPAAPSANIRLRFTRTPNGDRYIGYYAVLYRA